MRKFLLFLITILYFQQSYSQDFSNKGKEFWLAYSYHVGMAATSSGPPTMTLNMTSDVSTAFTVEIYGGPVISTGTITPGIVNIVTIPTAYFVNSDGLFNNRAIHVTAVKPIVIYAFQTRSAATGATLCLPTNVLGKEYYAMSFTQTSNEQNSNSYITIVGVEDGTNIEITPTAATTGGWAANTTHTITLNKGQVYQVLGTVGVSNGVDLSGSLIKSIASGTGGCKRIAVFSGSGKLFIGCNNSADNLYQQLYPVATWGKKYLTVPSYDRPTNFYRIMKSDPAAVVKLNGVIIGAAFTNGYYQFSNSTPNMIESDLPVSVTQYFTGQNCSGNFGNYDPDMIVLNPVEQNINKVTLISSNLTGPVAGHQHNLHVIMRNGGTGISSFKFDGAPLPATLTWITHPSDPNYSYVYIPNVSESGNLQPGHSLQSDSGFNALAYGYANAETYGYSAGTNVKDLYQQIGVQTQYGIETTPSVCTGSPFKFKISLPYKPLQLQWNLAGLPSSTLPNNTNITQNPGGAACTTLTGGEENQYVCHDSVTMVNGVPIWWYSLSFTYTINAVGIYPITITAQTGGVDGCGSEQEINFDLQVSAPPVAAFDFTAPGCAAEPVQFTDATVSAKPNYHWYYDFGDGTPISNLRNPVHTFAPGDWVVRFSSITTPGCLSDTLERSIHVPSQPSATISGTTEVCRNAPSPSVSFIPSGGKAPYTYSYTIDNGSGPGPVQTTTSNTITVPTAVPGTYTYNLTNISNANAAYCSTPVLNQSATVRVNPLPAVAISGTTIVCQNSTAPTITFTGTDGTAPYTINYKINGIAQTPVTTIATPPYTATVNVPTASFGNFIYTVTDVTDATTTACTTVYSAAIAPSANVKVEAMPTGTITGGTSTCKNGMQPTITFTATGGTDPYTFTYHIVTNGIPGPDITVQSTGGGIKTVPASSAATGTFDYVLTNVKSADGTICSTSLSPAATTTVQVNPLPTATISGAAAVCQNTITPTIITLTGANGTAPYIINYTINGIAQAPVVTNSGAGPHTATVTVPTGVTGSFNYTITDISDATTTACTTTYPAATAPSAIITVNERPTAAISGTAEVCLNTPPQTVTFTATGGTAPYTFTYNINGASNQTLNSPTAVATLTAPATTAGTFIYNLVSVTESSSTACVSNQPVSSATVIINPKPTASFNIVAPFCEQKAVTFTPAGNVSTGSIVSWVWDYGDGTGSHTLTNSNPFNIIYTTTGIKTATLKTITDKGCESDVFTQTFTVNARPDAGFILPEVCLLDPFAQFTDTSKPVGGISGWEWTFNDPNATPGNPNTSPAQHATHTYTAVGPYPVRLIITSNLGCKDTITQTLVINGGNPVSDFIVINPASLCSNDSVAVQNKSTITSGSITKLEIIWDNINFPLVVQTVDEPVFDKIYKHKYPTLTTDQNYTIRVRAYSGGVCFSDKIKIITVHAAPSVQFNTIPDVCLNNGTVQFTQGSETGGVAGGPGIYSGPGVSSGGLFTPTGPGPGIYTLTYTYTSSAGCTDFKTQTVKVLTAPVAEFTPGTPSCEKAPVTFTQSSTSTEGAITQWIWNFEGVDEIHTDGNAVTHTFNTSGIKTVTLTVVTAAGCRSTANVQQVTVNPRPAPDFRFTESACLPAANIVFTNTTPNPSENTYVWSFDYPSSVAGSTATGLNASHVYTAIGPYTVRLAALNIATGCTHFKDQPLNAIHPAPLASFDFSKLSICKDQDVTVIDHSSGADGTINTWTWYFGDNTNTVSGQLPPPHTYTEATTFDVKLSIQNNFGCTDDTSRKFTVYPYPAVNAGPDLFVLEGGSSVLQPIVTAVEPQFLWTSNTLSTYLDNNTIQNPVTKPLTDVTYTLTVTGKGSCAANDEVFVKVLKFPQIPNTFTPNNDGIHDFWEIGYLYTYPNNRVQVFSRTGQLVFESKGYAKPWDGNMNGKSLPVDTYYYIIEPGYGRKPITGYVTIIK